MIAVGTDILQICRIEEMVARQGDRFVRRILTEQEQHEYHTSKQASRLLAKRFAAKPHRKGSAPHGKPGGKPAGKPGGKPFRGGKPGGAPGAGGKPGGKPFRKKPRD